MARRKIVTMSFDIATTLFCHDAMPLFAIRCLTRCRRHDLSTSSMSHMRGAKEIARASAVRASMSAMSKEAPRVLIGAMPMAPMFAHAFRVISVG